MDFIRKLVSQNKKRLETDKFNLDLSYITPRLIAMAYPASGLESLFRNHIEDVAAYLAEAHPNGFLIVNLSNRKYDYAKFKGAVLDIIWPNHYPCPFFVLIELIGRVAHHLLADLASVVIVHCLAGKGRTGSFVVCLLLISRVFKSIDQANLFYEEKRGVRVSYGSQLRYLQYFQRFLKDGFQDMNFHPLRLLRVVMMTASGEYWTDKEFCLQLMDFSSGEIRKVSEYRVFGSDAQRLDSGTRLLYVDTQDVLLPGMDVLVALSTAGLVGCHTLLRLNLCLFYVSGSVTLKLPDCDDVSVGLPKDLRLRFDFRPQDDPQTEFEARNKCNEVWKIYQEVEKSLASPTAKAEFLCGDVRSLEGTGLPPVRESRNGCNSD